MKFFAAPFDFLQDVGGGSGPDKGFRISVVVVNMFLDGSGQFINAAKDAAASTF